MKRCAAWFGVLAALACAAVARSQPPTEVRIDISGAGQRIRLHCESLEPAGDRSARSWSARASVTCPMASSSAARLPRTPATRG